MVGLLADRSLYRYTGGETPPTVAELRERYARQIAGPRPPSADRWLNWIVRSDGVALGYVQATVMARTAEIAWVIGTAHQGQGYATEAAGAMAEALAETGTDTLQAHIHPRNRPSQIVAERLGLRKLPVHAFDGEDLWQRTL